MGDDGGPRGTMGDPRDSGDHGGWGRYVISTYERIHQLFVSTFYGKFRASWVGGDDGDEGGPSGPTGVLGM